MRSFEVEFNNSPNTVFKFSKFSSTVGVCMHSTGMSRRSKYTAIFFACLLVFRNELANANYTTDFLEKLYSGMFGRELRRTNPKHSYL